MGGHGGLNILPQKSWNVYGQKQRDRVRRDEEAHAARIAEEHADALDAARDARLGELRRAKVERGVDEDARRDVSVSGHGHVNLFAEEEAAAARSGGRNTTSKTISSAAQCEDESLRFGGRDGAGERNTPWYASANGQGGTAYESLPARIRREREEESALRKLSSTSRVQAVAAPASSSAKRSVDDRRLRESKIVKKEKKEKKRQKSSRDDVDEDALRRLREERIAREQRESARERALTGSGRPNYDEYRSGYGYQPPNKRPSNR